MFRIFGDKSKIDGEIFFIPKEDRNHLGNVIRLKEGDSFEAVVGNRLYELTYIDYDRARIVSFVKFVQEESPKISVFFSLLKGNKNELILQKCTEIGVTDFYPMNTMRTIPDLTGKEESRIKRWKKIVESSAKQSKSKFIPQVHYPINIGRIGQYLNKEDFTLVPYEKENTITIKEALSEYNGGNINIIIGPEGGFEPIEIISLIKQGAISISLGNKILRAETAAIFTVANIVYELKL